MKKFYFTILMICCAAIVQAQTTYYWVGGTAPTTSITIGTNWNTSLDGSGTSRPSSSGASDILIVDGSNVGGTTPATGTVALLGNGSITCAQLKFVNNASATIIRATSGTSTITLRGEAGEDFVIEAGCSFAIIPSTAGSLRFAMDAANTGRVSGTLRMVTPWQARFDNTTGGAAGALRFTSGSSFTTNITATSSSYAFGSSSQSTEKWVVFEDGSHLYYEGGYSPIGNNSVFTAIEFQPNSTYHHRADNGGGSFTNRRSFGNIVVENGATLTADGPVYRINNLTVNAGCGFVTHTSGQTAVMGNLTVDGSLGSPAGSFNELIMCGSAAQNITGAGTLTPASLLVGANANVSLAKNMSVENAATILGRMNFGTSQLSGTGTFNAEGPAATATATGNTITGSYIITGNTAIAAGMKGYLISGAGIAPNTSIIALSSTLDTIYISNALIATATGVAISANTTGAVLQTTNANGFNATTGSVINSGNHTFDDNINYIIDAATTTPFGITTGSSATSVATGFTDINADVTANTGVSVSQHFGVNGKFTLRPLDTLHILAGANFTGTFGPAHYIVTDYNTGAGTQGYIQYDGITAATTIPLGTPNNYMPVTLSPTGSSGFGINIFEGITINGQLTGTPFTTLQQQTVVNAVWNINRISGAGDVALNFGWSPALEGTAFATLPGTDIGVIQNSGALWSPPLGPGDNTNNTAGATVSTLSSFSIGAVAQVDPFVFNDLPVKTYGDVDFNGGATSLNTAQPIVYTSSNAAVATIVAGDIHITGAGTTDITATQASDGVYPAASITKTLTVVKAALTIKADAKTKFEGLPNPALTATYTSFVLGETASSLLTPAVLSTTATQASPPGKYVITVTGATSNNYEISFENDTLTILPKQNQTISFTALPVKNYGNADFNAIVSSTNTTIPVLLTSSNTAVATVSGNSIHIVGAGTTDITASQAGNDGYFPAANVVRTLTVNKVPLTIRVRDTTKIQGTANPDFTVTYTGFVLGETAANLTPSPVVSTTATSNSIPGLYVLGLSAAGSQNYTINQLPGVLRVLPAGDTTRQQVYAYVNGANNLIITLYSPAATLSDVFLFDMSGKLVRKKNVFMPKGVITTSLNLFTLPNGVYAVRVKGPDTDLKTLVSIVR